MPNSFSSVPVEPRLFTQYCTVIEPLEGVRTVPTLSPEVIRLHPQDYHLAISQMQIELPELWNDFSIVYPLDEDQFIKGACVPNRAFMDPRFLDKEAEQAIKFWAELGQDRDPTYLRNLLTNAAPLGSVSVLAQREGSGQASPLPLNVQYDPACGFVITCKWPSAYIGERVIWIGQRLPHLRKANHYPIVISQPTRMAHLCFGVRGFDASVWADFFPSSFRSPPRVIPRDGCGAYCYDFGRQVVQGSMDFVWVEGAATPPMV